MTKVRVNDMAWVARTRSFVGELSQFGLRPDCLYSRLSLDIEDMPEVSLTLTDWLRDDHGDVISWNYTVYHLDRSRIPDRYAQARYFLINS